MTSFENYKSRKVLLTGHTGFKGSWMTRWLLNLGAEVYGYALEPDTDPSLFVQLSNQDSMDSTIADVRDKSTLKETLNRVKPDIIFHLAAQPLVRESYITPAETWETNVNGTINLLEAVRNLNLSTSIVVVTSDKCYENKEWIYGYRENDPLGGYDPYSSSKGAAELVVSSWRRSFFHPEKHEDHGVRLASARAGNVIGGGDWAKDRIIPDTIRALMKSETIGVRNPLATRPWQHVLESIGGYLLLGSRLLSDSDSSLCDAFNFGPYGVSNKTVESLVEEALKHWSGQWDYKKEHAVHEAFLLNLNIDKANQYLGWRPIWGFEETVKNTIEWYKSVHEDPDCAIAVTDRQIQEYQKDFFQQLNG